MSEPREVLTPANLQGLITKAGDTEGPERVLLYSDPGAGKTPLLASANRVAAFSPLLLINLDGSDATKSIKTSFPEVDVINIKNFKTLYEVFSMIRNSNGAGFKSVCVDGGTSVQVRGIEHLYYKDRGGRNNNFLDFESASMQNGGWDANKDQMRIFFDAFTGLPVHLFVTAWRRNIARMPKKIGEYVPPYWVPDFTPKVLNAACGRFSSVLYLYKHETTGKRVLQSRTGNTVMARDRGDRLPKILEDPTMEKMAKYWDLDCSPVFGGTPNYDGK
jgi:hypothetical protein